jgi:hypothetical protein
VAWNYSHLRLRGQLNEGSLLSCFGARMTCGDHSSESARVWHQRLRLMVHTVLGIVSRYQSRCLQLSGTATGTGTSLGLETVAAPEQEAFNRGGTG